MSSNALKQRSEVVRIEQFLKEVHIELKDSIKNLEDRELNWRPSQSSNSIGNLLKHILGSEAFWIHHIVGGLESQRIRASEFTIEDFNFKNLQNELIKTKRMTKKVLIELNDEQLSELRTYWSQLTNQHRERTVYWCLMHSIEHSALHIGQIFYIRRLFRDLIKRN
ncbi:MAG: DinB family protein [Promethearchaeota archaeon]